MASFSINLIHITIIKAHYRIFLIPWVKRNSLLCCAWGREYSSSFPVKYIPKNSVGEIFEPSSLCLKNLVEREKHDSLDMNVPGVTSLRRVMDNRLENHNFLRIANITYCLICEWFSQSGISYMENYDGILTCFVMILEVDEDKEDDFITVNDDVTEDVGDFVEDYSSICQGIQAGQNQQGVEKSAIELLASRTFTSLELKRKLMRKRYPLEVVDALIMDFQRRGLINDCLYAETFARSRWSSSSWGPRRIKQELLKKGVSGVDAEKAIKLVFENDTANEDQDSGLVMSKLSIDRLFVQASKQWMRSLAISHETRKSRIIRWLQYRGYSWSVTKYILKKLESECPS